MSEINVNLSKILGNLTKIVEKMVKTSENSQNSAEKAENNDKINEKLRVSSKNANSYSDSDDDSDVDLEVLSTKVEKMAENSAKTHEISIGKNVITVENFIYVYKVMSEDNSKINYNQQNSGIISNAAQGIENANHATGDNANQAGDNAKLANQVDNSKLAQGDNNQVADNIYNNNQNLSTHDAIISDGITSKIDDLKQLNDIKDLGIDEETYEHFVIFGEIIYKKANLTPYLSKDLKTHFNISLAYFKSDTNEEVKNLCYFQCAYAFITQVYALFDKAYAIYTDDSITNTKSLHANTKKLRHLIDDVFKYADYYLDNSYNPSDLRTMYNERNIQEFLWNTDRPYKLFDNGNNSRLTADDVKGLTEILKSIHAKITPSIYKLICYLGNGTTDAVYDDSIKYKLHIGSFDTDNTSEYFENITLPNNSKIRVKRRIDEVVYNESSEKYDYYVYTQEHMCCSMYLFAEHVNPGILDQAVDKYQTRRLYANCHKLLTRLPLVAFAYYSNDIKSNIYNVTDVSNGAGIAGITKRDTVNKRLKEHYKDTNKKGSIISKDSFNIMSLQDTSDITKNVSTIEASAIELLKAKNKRNEENQAKSNVENAILAIKTLDSEFTFTPHTTDDENDYSTNEAYKCTGNENSKILASELYRYIYEQSIHDASHTQYSTTSYLKQEAISEIESLADKYADSFINNVNSDEYKSIAISRDNKIDFVNEYNMDKDDYYAYDKYSIHSKSDIDTLTKLIETINTHENIAVKQYLLLHFNVMFFASMINSIIKEHNDSLDKPKEKAKTTKNTRRKGLM